jgi:hypothetical protein
MKALQLSVAMLFLFALSSTSYAGHSNKDGTQGTDPESECEYTSAPELL